MVRAAADSRADNTPVQSTDLVKHMSAPILGYMAAPDQNITADQVEAMRAR